MAYRISCRKTIAIQYLTKLKGMINKPNGTGSTLKEKLIMIIGFIVVVCLLYAINENIRRMNKK
jgi:hypothetical protein